MFWVVLTALIGIPQEPSAPHITTNAPTIFRFFIRASFKIRAYASRKRFAREAELLAHSRAFAVFHVYFLSLAMVRFLILLAALPIIAAFIARWWLGLRVLSSAGRRQCSCDFGLWEKAFGAEHLPPSKSGDARIFAETLRKAALADWKTREPKSAASREGVRRFGMAVPPLSLMAVILAVIVGRISAIWAVPVFLLAVAVAIIFSYLSIAPELNAMLLASRRLRASGAFHRRDDEDAVIAATTALVWKESAPPVFNLIQK